MGRELAEQRFFSIFVELPSMVKASARARRGSSGGEQPFVLPAISFYFLTLISAVAAFFFFWWVLNDVFVESAWILAAIIAFTSLISAVVLREVVLKIRRNNLLLAQNQLDKNLQKASRLAQTDEEKFTLEKNAAFLYKIKLKSEAANVLDLIPDAHWEVFELCEDYLHRTKHELETVRAGSPRLAALTQGRKQVQSLHKHHLLTWSATESKNLLQQAGSAEQFTDKVEIADKALNILDSALRFYPDEVKLIESASAINEFVTSVKLSNWIKRAEAEVFKGNRNKALNHYRDALFYLARDNVRTRERDLIAERINLEIEKLKVS